MTRDDLYRLIENAGWRMLTWAGQHRTNDEALRVAAMFTRHPSTTPDWPAVPAAPDRREFIDLDSGARPLPPSMQGPHRRA